MKTIEIQSKNKIEEIFDNTYVPRSGYMPLLFHGTDASLISLSEVERKEINEVCETIILSVYRLLKKHSIRLTDKRLINSRDSHGNSSYAYVCAEARINSSPLYCYKDFYATNNLPRAIRFSDEAWIYGETGWVAKRLVDGLAEIGINLPNDDQFMRAYELFEHRKQCKKNPVVLIISRCPISCCRTEDDKSISDIWGDKLPDNRIAMNYRISMDSIYEYSSIYMIKDELYEDLMITWNKTMNYKES